MLLSGLLQKPSVGSCPRGRCKSLEGPLLSSREGIRACVGGDPRVASPSGQE